MQVKSRIAECRRSTASAETARSKNVNLMPGVYEYAYRQLRFLRHETVAGPNGRAMEVAASELIQIALGDAP